MVSDYFARFNDTISDHFVEGNVGEHNGYFFDSEYVSRDNKRRVVFFVTHGLPEEARVLTRVTYGLPVSADGAPLFKLEGVQPDTPPTFAEMAIPAGQTTPDFIAAYVAGNNLAGWGSEVARVAALEAAAEPGKARRAYHNVGIYWRDQRRRFYDAIFNSTIRMLRTSSGRLRSSEELRRRRRTTSPAGPNPGSQHTSTHRSTSDPRASTPVSRRLTSASRKSSSKSSSKQNLLRKTKKRKSTSDPA